MMTKEIAIHTIEELPDNATWADVQERINFVAGVRKGLHELDEGQGIPHAQVKEEFAQWLGKCRSRPPPVSICAKFRLHRRG
jgi:hypothetical protein